MSSAEATASTSALLARAEMRRAMALGSSTPERRAELGQFFTPAPVAELMAGLVRIQQLPSTVRLLDPGAGVGSLTAAIVTRLVAEDPTRSLEAVTYEVDPQLAADLQATLDDCAAEAAAAGMATSFQAYVQDYVEARSRCWTPAACSMP